MSKKHFVIFLVLFGFGGSVSCSYLQKQFLKFKLSAGADKKAKKVAYIPPPFPYKEEKTGKLDKLWRNTKDKSSISYFSSCSKNHEYLNFQEIQKTVLSEIPHWNLLKTKSTPHFLQSHFEIAGTNYKTINSIYIFKNKFCFFVLNFTAGSQAIFEKNEPLFMNFIKSFKSLL